MLILLFDELLLGSCSRLAEHKGKFCELLGDLPRENAAGW